MNHSIIPSSDAGYPIPVSSEEYAAPGSPGGARRIGFFLRKFWWLPLLTLVLSLGAVAGYLYQWAPRYYVSSASMWETEKLRLPEGAAFTDNIQDYMGTQMELLRSGLEQRVSERLKAQKSNAAAQRMGKEDEPIKVDVTVKQAPKSTILMIEAVSTNAEYTRIYLNALLDEYVEYKKHVRKTVSDGTWDSINDQVLQRESDLREAQSNFSVFERTNNLAILQEEGTVHASYLAKLQTELSDLQLESQLLDATAAQRNQSAAGSANVPPDSSYNAREPDAGAAQPPAAELAPLQEVELLKSEREKLSRNLRPAHPKIVKLDAQIQRDERIIDMFRHQAREQFAASRQNMATRMEKVKALINVWEGKMTDANSHIALAEELKLKVNRAQSLFDRLDTLLQTVSISRNIDQETLAILKPASPAERSYASEIRLLLTSGIGGLVFGFCLVALAGLRDDRFTTLSEVNEKFGDVIVGQVPDMPKLQGQARMPLLEIEDDRDMYAESYRSLRSAILFMPREGEPPKILLVTSALPDEGKSTIAANLARTLALGGSRVLLVDGDLRRGYLHDLLGMRLEPGLVDLLDRPDDLEKIIQSDSLPNFAFLSRGKTVPNPGDLFLSAKLDQMFVRLREKFDYVIIDSSPIFAADDAASLAPRVDGTLFVVRSRFSPAGAVKEALDLLGQRQVRVLGLVFNRAETSGRSYYYYKNPEYYRPKKTA